MIKVTDEKGAWNKEAEELMLEVLGHEHDKRIRVIQDVSFGWRGMPSRATRLVLRDDVSYPHIKRWVNVVNGEVDKVKIKAKYLELLAMIPDLEAAKAERLVAYNLNQVEDYTERLATVEEYLSALDTLNPRVKALVEKELDREYRHYVYGPAYRETLETNEEMLLRLRQELELARKEVG